MSAGAAWNAPSRRTPSRAVACTSSTSMCVRPGAMANVRSEPPGPPMARVGFTWLLLPGFGVYLLVVALQGGRQPGGAAAAPVADGERVALDPEREAVQVARGRP